MSRLLTAILVLVIVAALAGLEAAPASAEAAPGTDGPCGNNCEVRLHATDHVKAWSSPERFSPNLAAYFEVFRKGRSASPSFAGDFAIIFTDRGLTVKVSASRRYGPIQVRYWATKPMRFRLTYR